MLKKMCLSVLLMCAALAFANDGPSEMAVQLFGKQEASGPIAKGAVFIDGLFVKAPYRVSQEGNCILINGQVASRFKVEAAASKPAEPAPADEGADGSDAVSEEDGASIADMPKQKGASELEKRLAKRNAKGGSIEERLNARKRKTANQAKAASGSFNSEALSSDPTALFEEADYTYTPPKRPDPKPVPYIRPGASKSTAERLADAKAREAAQQERQKGSAAAEEESTELATEDFDGLTETEIADYTEQFRKRQKLLEACLEKDGLLLLSSNTSAAKVENKKTMQRFVVALSKPSAKQTEAKFVAQWKKDLPAAYLKRVYANRKANAKALAALVKRLRAEAKD